ncbi:MAG: hypothetical protein KDA75_19820 [Planctomycetaceae bacterium]|nr:hypothetical protein [Planctomycetaceae bacterium]
MTSHVTTPLQAFQTAAERTQLASTLDAVRDICRLPETPEDEQLAACIAEQLQSREWLAAAEPVVAGILAESDVQPLAGRLWSQIQVRQEHWDAFKQLRVMVDDGPAGEAAAETWLQLLVERRQPLQLLRMASLGEHWLRRRPLLWGATLDALRTLRQFRAARFWIAHWQDFRSLDDRDLLNVAEILRATGQSRDAAEVNRLGWERSPESPGHACWLAVDDALAGDYEATEKRLQAIDSAALSPEYRSLHTLAAAAVSVGRADAQRLPEVLTVARQSLDDLRGADPSLADDPARRVVYHKVLEQLADSGGVTMQLWAWWRRFRS